MIKVRLQGQIGHTDNGIHRRPYLMGHICQKVRFSPGCRLGCFFGQTELGNITCHPANCKNIPVMICHWKLIGHIITNLAVSTDKIPRHLNGQAALHHFFICDGEPLSQFSIEQFNGCFTNGIILADPGDLTPNPVYEQITATQITKADHCRRVI